MVDYGLCMNVYVFVSLYSLFETMSICVYQKTFLYNCSAAQKL